MPLVLADRVRDTTTTTGTGTVTLSGTAPSGYQNFSVVGNGNTTYYTINAGSQWEVGIGTYSSTGPTLARTTVLASSNSGSLVDFSAGTKDVFVTYPAGESVYQDGASIAAGTAVLGVANGGTGATTLSSGYLVKGNGTSAVSASVIYDNGANVGIGTSSATERLTVSGNGTFTNATYCAVGATSDAVQGQYAANGAAGEVSLRAVSNHPLNFFTNNTERMRITAAGFVGIGTVSPSQRLDVAGSINAGTTNGVTLFMADSSAIRNTATAGNTMYFDSGVGTGSTTGDFQFRSTASFTTRLYINGATGSVGVGTTSPARLFEVTATGTNIPARLGNSQGNLDIGGSDGVVVNIDTRSWAMGLQTGGTERMRITTAGLVGIGTSAPAELLDVNAATTSTGYTDFVVFRQVNGAGTHSRILFGQNSTNSMFIEVANQANTKGNLLLQPFGGNVGVGTGSPAFNLDVTGTGRFTGLTQFDNDITLNKATLNYLYFNDALAFARNGVGERMRIDTSGNVGIGTSSPSSRLTVQGDELIIPAAGWTSGQAARLYLGDTNNGVQSVNGSYQTYFAFNGHSWNVNGTEAMRIDGSRNVGIGTSTPGYRLDVSGVINTNAAVRMTPTNVGAFTRAQLQSAYNLDGTGASVFTWNYTNGGGELDLFINRNGGGTGGLKIYDFPNTSGDPTNIFTVEGGGNVGIGTASPATSLSVVTNTTSHIGMRVTNNSTTQFAGSGLQMLGPSAAGTQGGAAIYYYNTTVGGTQGGMAMAQLANNGSFQRNLAYYDFNNQSWAFLTSGSERLSITSGGSVGIGTSSPATTLDVAGAIRSSTGASDPGTGTVLYFVGSGSFQTVVAGAAFAVHTGNNNARTERMRIDINGNAGIGTSSPGAKLDVTTASGANIVVSRSSAAGYAAFQRIAPAGQQVYDFYTINNTEAGRITVDGSNFMAFSTGSSATERMRIDSSGNVGIGTSSPGAKLQINTQDGFRFDVEAGAASTMRFGSASTGEATAALAFTRTTGVISLSSGSTGSALNERMRIDGSGNVAIGTTTTASRLRVAAGAQINAPVLGNVTNYPAFLSGPDTGFGLGIGTNNADGRTWLQAQRSDGNAATYPITLNEAGGNVGIGTSAPGSKLTVVGGAVQQYKASGDNNAFLGSTSDTSNNYLRLQNSVNTVDLTCSNGSAYLNSAQSVLWFGTNGVERMRLSGSELLVGTTTGGRTVCINAADNWMRMSNPSRSWLIGMGTTSTFYIWDETGGGPRFWVDTSGSINAPNSFFLGSGANNDNKIEIGAGRTGNNYAYIDLIGDTTYTDYGLRLIRGNGGPNATSQLVHRGSGDMYISTQDGAPMYFQTNGTTRAYFQSDGTMVMNGALLVGRNTVGSNVNTNNDTGSFSVRGDGSNAASISFHRTGAFAMNMGLGTDAIFRMGGWSMSSNCFQMDGSGNLTMLGNVTAYSDARIKKDVETIGSALDLVSKMRGVRYTRIDSGKRGVGVIAQEMLEVLPEVVQQGVGDDDTLSVAYGNLVGVLIEAVKELTARVAELEGK